MCLGFACWIRVLLLLLATCPAFACWVRVLLLLLALDAASVLFSLFFFAGRSLIFGVSRMPNV